MSIEYPKNVAIRWLVVGFGVPFMMIMPLTWTSPAMAFPCLRPSGTGRNSLRPVTISRWQSKTSANDEKGGPDDGPEELEWRNLLDGVRQPLNAKPPNARLDPLMGYTYDDLHRYAETTRDRKLSMEHFPPGTIEEEDLDSEAMFLDPEAYLQLSRDSFHLDDDPVSTGSNAYYMDDIRFREPMQGYLEAISRSPSDGYVSDSPIDPMMKDSGTLDDVWSMIGALQQRQRNSSSAEWSKDLHHLIFQEEGGFYNQSSVFLESLTNSSKATEANIERRGRRFRNRQEEAIASLNQQIDEMEALLLKQQQSPKSKKQRCCRCNSFLSDEELRKGDAKTETVGNAMCRVCYMEQLLTESKRIEVDRLKNRQQQARTALQSYRRSENMREHPKNGAAVRTYQNVPYRGNNNVRSRTSVESNLPQSDTEDSSSHSTINQAIHPNVPSAGGTDTAIHMSTMQNTTADRVSVAESPMLSESIHPWVEMIDPDTNEIFYWNEETEEMRLEL
jgi:hypothetical protein